MPLTKLMLELENRIAAANAAGTPLTCTEVMHDLDLIWQDDRPAVGENDPEDEDDGPEETSDEFDLRVEKFDEAMALMVDVLRKLSPVQPLPTTPTGDSESAELIYATEQPREVLLFDPEQELGPQEDEAFEILPY
jgi:hypothetical protein